MRVVVAVTVDRVEDAVGSFVKTVAERMVLAVFVVISHITLVLLGTVDGSSSSLFYTNVSLRVTRVDDVNLASRGGIGVVLGRVGLLGVAGSLLVVGAGTEVESCSTYDGTCAFAELTLGDVNLRGSVVGGGTVDSVEVPVVGLVLDVDLRVDVGAVRLLVAVTGLELDVNTLARLLFVAGFFVDVNLVAALGRAGVAVLFVDSDLLLVALVASVGGEDGGREGFAVLFVTFPSDVCR